MSQQTKNDLSYETRSQITDTLGALLFDAVDLQLNCKTAHWNVKGPSFIALHGLFDSTYEAVGEYVDLIAERIVQLGGTACGGAREVASNSRLEAYPTGITSGPDHCDALSNSLAAFGASVRAAIDSCSEAGDQGSADICTEISRGIDKSLWFVESHLSM